MSGSRWLIILLALAGLGLQAELWFSDDGYRKTLKLRNAVAEQRDGAIHEDLAAARPAVVVDVEDPHGGILSGARNDSPQQLVELRGGFEARQVGRPGHDLE